MEKSFHDVSGAWKIILAFDSFMHSTPKAIVAHNILILSSAFNATNPKGRVVVEKLFHMLHLKVNNKEIYNNAWSFIMLNLFSC